jgi:hypothetical protein
LDDVSDELVILGSGAEIPASVCVHINSPGIGAAGKLALQSIVLPKIAKEAHYEFNVEEDDLWKQNE